MNGTNDKKTALVAGAGGFIGGHLSKKLLDCGFHVVGVDIKPRREWWQIHPGMEVMGECDLRLRGMASIAVVSSRPSLIFNLAADMGGIGFIDKHKAACMLSVLINTNLLEEAREIDCVERYFYASSACVYAADKQTDPNVTALKESDAYPAMPEDGYGWEKLFSERMCRHFREDYGLETRIGRFHNIYGPHGTWKGGREKAPAAICRKVIEAKYTGRYKIEIWGDGLQTRSFCWVDDCVHGIIRLADSDFCAPMNIGSSELVTINELVDLAESFAGIRLNRAYDMSAPKGVAGRNSDNTLIKETLDWEPSTNLFDGLRQTYRWIENEYLKEQDGIL